MTHPSPPPARRPRTGILAGAPVTQAIVIVTVACWLVGLIPGVELGRLLGFSPLLSATEPWRALTVMVVHADVLHLLFNMVGVLLFGSFVERSLGHARFLAVYLLSGLGGSAAVLLLAAPYEPGWFSLHVGASGALFGLLGVVLTPTRSLDRNWGGAAVFLVLNVIYSAVSPGISWESHMGGLVVGFALGLRGTAAEARRRLSARSCVGRVVLGSSRGPARDDGRCGAAGAAGLCPHGRVKHCCWPSEHSACPLRLRGGAG